MADHSTSGRDGTTRRSALRSLAATATAITAGVGVANAGEDPSPFHDPVDAPELPYPDKTVFTYDNSLRKITSQAYLLALSEKAIDRHFDTSNLEGREFERARQYVRNLRKRYPTRTVERDEETVFELSHEARRNLHLDRRSGRPLAENASPSGDRPSPSNGGVPSQQCDADRDALEATIQAFSGTGDSLEQSNTDVGIQ